MQAQSTTSGPYKAGTRPLILIALCLLGSNALAQSDDPSSSLTVFGGLGFGGNFETDVDIDIELDDGANLGLIFNFNETSTTQWEVIYLRNETAAQTQDLFSTRPSIDTEIQYFQGGGTYTSGGSAKVRPYVAGGFGLTNIDPRGQNTESDTFWSLSIGGGVQFNTSERLGFRLEARVFGTFVDSNSTIFCGSAAGGGCLVNVEGDMLWQSQVFGGITFRF